MGLEIVLALYIIAALFIVAAHILFRRMGHTENLLRKTGKILVGWIIVPKILAVVLLLAAGTALIIASHHYHTYRLATGYRYTIIPETASLRYVDGTCIPTGGYVAGESVVVGAACSFVERFTSDRAVVGVNVLETPMYTAFVQLLFDPGLFLIGFALILLGLFLGAVFLVRLNNTIYSMQENQ